MEFVFCLLALAAAFAVWHFLYSDAVFTTYLTSLSAQYGPKCRIVFWLSVGFAAWGLITFHGAPGYISMLISLVFAVLWLSSPAGQAKLKSLV